MKEFLELGSWEHFFPGRPRVVSRHPLFDRYALKSGSVLLSGVFASCEDSVSTLLANKGVDLCPTSPDPVASRPPLVDRSALAASR